MHMYSTYSKYSTSKCILTLSYNINFILYIHVHSIVEYGQRSRTILILGFTDASH